MKMRNVYIPDDVWEQLRERADKRSAIEGKPVSISEIVRRTITRALRNNGEIMSLSASSTPFQVAHVNTLLIEVRRLWDLACAWDRVDPYNREYIPELSADNPYADQLNQAIDAYHEELKR